MFERASTYVMIIKVLLVKRSCVLRNFFFCVVMVCLVVLASIMFYIKKKSIITLKERATEIMKSASIKCKYKLLLH